MSTTIPVRHAGNENLFLAVEMSLIATDAGVPLHIHAEGLRGTGKTTVMRWAKTVAPDIHRIKGCQYQCNPYSPHCPVHDTHSQIPDDQWETARMPFVEIGHGAKLGTVLGSVDLGKLTDVKNPEAALIPGSIPVSNRGIILVDEINRLAETAPEITDVLLSVMGTKPGRIKIEEVGIVPWELEITSSVWATSNPDEDPGPLEEIRRQLSDRFDIVVPVQRPLDPLVVEKLLWGNNQNTQSHTMAPAEIKKKAAALKDITIPQSIVRYLAALYVDKNIESLRAIESLALSSRCLAAIREKTEVSFDEISTVLPLVLRHRVPPMMLTEILKDLQLRRAACVQVAPREGADDDPSLPDGKEPTEAITSVSDPGKELDKGLEREQPEKSLNQDEIETTESENRRQSGWMRRLMSKWQTPKAQPSSSNCQTGSSTLAPSARPVSPPDPARKIVFLNWDEIILPSEWKDPV